MVAPVPVSFQPNAEESLSPVYPFGLSGQPIVLHDGPVGGLAATDIPGVVQLSCVPRPSLEWRVDADAPPFFANRSDVRLVLRRWNGDTQVSGVVRGIDGGWSNGAVLGTADAPLKRMVVHWFNLPNWHGPIGVTTATPNGAQTWWTGRWRTEAEGWTITLDVRPDHREVWQDLDAAHVYVMTHVMELRRTDGAAFTAVEAEPVLTALHVGVSFALGRWAAPMLPVGEDAHGNAVWENWRAYHCDPARSTAAGWWYEQDHTSLADLVRRVVAAFTDPKRRTALRLQVSFAVEAINDRGFVEQRVMIGAAGLEHFMWQALVLSGQMTEAQYKDTRRNPAHAKLRRVLDNAQIPVDIDAHLLPTIARFAEGKKESGKPLDGAHIVTQIRNRLLHPEGAQDAIYQPTLDGLVAEVWRLTGHYLALLILHSLDYRGSYRDLRRTTGWAGETTPVPWM
jgi:hypothetical protein